MYIWDFFDDWFPVLTDILNNTGPMNCASRKMCQIKELKFICDMFFVNFYGKQWHFKLNKCLVIAKTVKSVQSVDFADSWWNNFTSFLTNFLLLNFVKADIFNLMLSKNVEQTIIIKFKENMFLKTWHFGYCAEQWKSTSPFFPVPSPSSELFCILGALFPNDVLILLFYPLIQFSELEASVVPDES